MPKAAGGAHGYYCTKKKKFQYKKKVKQSKEKENFCSFHYNYKSFFYFITNCSIV